MPITTPMSVLPGPRAPSAPPLSDGAFARFFELSSDVLAIIDAATNEIVAINHSSVRVLGYAADEVTGLSWTVFLPSEDVERARAAVGSACSSGAEPVRLTTRVSHRDSRVLWIEWSVAGPYDGRLYVLGRDASTGQRRLAAPAGLARPPVVHEPWIVEDLRAALDQDRLRVYAQPICNLKTRQVARYELLVRMVAADGTIVPPCMFLPAAERCGLISEIDAWVIDRGVHIASLGTAVNLNVSAASLARTDLLEPVRRAVDRGLDAASLAFEITETAMAADLDNAIAFAARAGDLGCGLVIDDFGVGFGSLTYVQRLAHVCCLKIDRTFITHVVERSVDQRIVSAVVCLAESFDQETVAEGIETEEALDLLRSLGVRHGQGYLFGRPAPASRLEHSLQ